ncbi:MAG: N-acetyltransferase family protein [Candidatus Methanosuratincola sp.]|jgi:ribosomal protein S18 acetylase RimI-like enzyme|nr:GNAT family N-acetyltransferase [Candidatus Methanosuratincola sp.]
MTRVRRLRHEDVPEAVQIINAQYSASYEEIPLAAESFIDYVRKRKPTLLVAEDSGRILGVISLVVWPWGNCIDLLAAAQTSENQLIEDLLVHELEQLAGVDSVYTNVEEGSPLISRWEQRGYSLDGGVYHLTIPLSCQKQVPPTRCAATIRSLRSEELDALVDLMNRSFRFERLSMEEVRSWWEVPGFSEEWIQVAEVENRIVSATVCMPDHEYSKHFGRLRGYLGPAATLPEYRNMGLTSALTVTALNFLFRKGMESAAMYIFEKNKASLGLALKIGFRIAKHWVHMNKDLEKSALQQCSP